MDLSTAQILASLVSTIFVPALAYYIKSVVTEGQRKYEERIAQLELALEKRFNEYNIINSNHITESEIRYKNFDVRILNLESNWRTVHDRFNQVQLNIASTLKEIAAGVNAPGHGLNQGGQGHGERYGGGD